MRITNEIWGTIKYKPKNGCEEAFLEAVARLEEMKKEVAGRTSRWIRLSSDEIVQISSHPDLDIMMEGQDTGLTWLDSVDHLLEKYEGGSRTDAFSGFKLENLGTEL